jgi:uncharacterized phage protein (TIGR01671 family)
MRQIKFRGKDIENGIFLFGDLRQRIGFFPAIIESYCTDEGKVGYREIAVEPKTVGQYTGLKDKNGNHIYEGDIVDLSPRYIRPHRIEYSYGQWICVDADAGWIPLIEDFQLGDKMNDVEVIGNIFDNPEMMEKDKED